MNNKPKSTTKKSGRIELVPREAPYRMVSAWWIMASNEYIVDLLRKNDPNDLLIQALKLGDPSDPDKEAQRQLLIDFADDDAARAAFATLQSRWAQMIAGYTGHQCRFVRSAQKITSLNPDKDHGPIKVEKA